MPQVWQCVDIQTQEQRYVYHLPCVPVSVQESWGETMKKTKPPNFRVVDGTCGKCRYFSSGYGIDAPACLRYNYQTEFNNTCDDFDDED